MSNTENSGIIVTNAGIDALATSMIAYGISRIPNTPETGYILLTIGVVLYLVKAVLKLR